MSSRFTNYGNLNSDVVKEVMDIAEKIEKEKQNAEPDTKEISKLMYQQLMKGMYLNSGFQSVNLFIRVFKATYGITPLQYRKN